MKEYNFTEARQHFAHVLDDAKANGVVCIKRRNGETFYIRPAISQGSPLDIEGVDLDLSADDIVEIVRGGRERDYG